MAASESPYTSSFSDTSSDADDEAAGPAVAAAGANAAVVAAASAPGAAGQEAARVPLPADGGAGDGEGGRPGSVVRDPEWRAYRRTLEWRCRWVEVRMAELREQERRYARLDAKLRAREESAGAAAAQPPQPVAEGEQTPQEQPARSADARLHHRRRRERRPARHTPGMAAVFAPLREAPPPLVFLPPSGGGDDSGSDSDLSASALFDAAAAVHGRIHELFSTLAAHRSASGLPPAPPRPSFAHLTAGGGGGGGGGGGAQRGFGGGHVGRGHRGGDYGAAAAAAMPPPPPPRRERAVADFDICDVVGALGGGPKVVERAPHVDIATPGVRPAPRAPWELPDARAAAAAHAAALAAAEKAERARRKAAASAAAAAAASAAAAERAGSSSEDTTDEAFAARHMPMEALEKKLRLGPAPGRGSGAVGRGQNNNGASNAAPAAPGDAARDPAAAADAAAAAPGLAAAPSCGAAAAEWSVSRPDGPKRAHVLIIKRAEAV